MRPHTRTNSLASSYPNDPGCIAPAFDSPNNFSNSQSPHAYYINGLSDDSHTRSSSCYSSFFTNDNNLALLNNTSNLDHQLNNNNNNNNKSLHYHSHDLLSLLPTTTNYTNQQAYPDPYLTTNSSNQDLIYPHHHSLPYNQSDYYSPDPNSLLTIPNCASSVPHPTHHVDKQFNHLKDQSLLNCSQPALPLSSDFLFPPINTPSSACFPNTFTSQPLLNQALTMDTSPSYLLRSPFPTATTTTTATTTCNVLNYTPCSYNNNGLVNHTAPLPLIHDTPNLYNNNHWIPPTYTHQQQNQQCPTSLPFALSDGGANPQYAQSAWIDQDPPINFDLDLTLNPHDNPTNPLLPRNLMDLCAPSHPQQSNLYPPPTNASLLNTTVPSIHSDRTTKLKKHPQPRPRKLGKQTRSHESALYPEIPSVVGTALGTCTVMIPNSAAPIHIPAEASAAHAPPTNEQHACVQCGKIFSKAFNLRSHMRSHLPEKPYKCPWPLCTKAFTRKHDCVRHFRTHSTVSPNRPLACPAPACSRRFARPSTLNRHLVESIECARIARVLHATASANQVGHPVSESSGLSQDQLSSLKKRISLDDGKAPATIRHSLLGAKCFPSSPLPPPIRYSHPVPTGFPAAAEQMPIQTLCDEFRTCRPPTSCHDYTAGNPSPSLLFSDRLSLQSSAMVVASIQ